MSVADGSPGAVPQEGRDLLTGAYLGPNPPQMYTTDI